MCIVMDMILLIVFLTAAAFPYTSESHELSHPDCLVWGPGIKPNIDLTVRYFYIQAVDSSGNNVTHSLGDAFAVNIYTETESRLRIYKQVMDRHDGSYLVRYRLFNSYKDLNVEVLYNGRHVSNSPYNIKGMTYHENCNCPQSSFNTWLKDMGCPKSYPQIKSDLSIFSNINMREVERDVVSRFNLRGSHSLCHYVIKDNMIYRKTYGQHVDFKMYVDRILLSLSRKVTLPDMEFFSNLGDWPLEKRALSEGPQPIFSWCGSDDTRDIVMPTYDITEATLEAMGRVSLDMLSVQAETGPAWHNKSSLTFWRGRDSRQERLDLVKLSRKHPTIVDAKLTNMFFFKHTEDLGEIATRVSFYDFFKHKYQINVDGTVAAYRLPYLLAGDSVVLKQDSPYYEFFYKQLKPYEHYIPVKRDLSDLLDQIQWAKEHDEEAQKIALNAQHFAREHLQGLDVFCYHAILFKEYAKLLQSDVQVLEGMELVEQPSDEDSRCRCPRRLKSKKDEL